jgi:peptidoglycan/LPS O-acetylase OafA/YrhL
MANYAVVGFFFLSGALICDSILKNFKRNGRFEWLEYLISRIARIYPSLFAAIILATIYYFIIGSHSLLIPGDKYVARELYSITFLDVQQALLMLEPGMFSVNGSLWSLFIEWRLYMWAMFLALFIDRKVCISDQSDHACRTKLTTDVGVN